MTHPGARPTTTTHTDRPARPTDRWWDREAPRVPAAALVLLLGVVQVAVAAVLGVWLGVSRMGETYTALYLLPSLGGLLVAVAAAAVLLTGSRGARLVGALVAVGLGVQTVAPLLAARPLGGGAGLAAAAVTLLVLGVVTAAALPLPGRAAPRDLADA